MEKKNFFQGDCPSTASRFGGFANTNAASFFEKKPILKPRPGATRLKFEIEAPTLSHLNKEYTPGEEGILEVFEHFGAHAVDWPCRGETTPREYVFLVFEEEINVREMVASYSSDEERTVLRVSHNSLIKMQIHPWRLADTDYLVHPSVPVDSKRTIFIGGIPRPISAVELAHLMEKYGPVLAAGIDIDVDYKYPKGVGRVVFEHWSSHRQAVADRHTIFCHGDMQKRVEMKPYVLEEMSCEECSQHQAPFFCSHLDCLQYYCESCWTRMYSRGAGWDSHKPQIRMSRWKSWRSGMTVIFGLYCAIDCGSSIKA